MDAAEGLLKRYFRVVAKPIALALLFYIAIIWLCFFFWFTIGGDPRQIIIDPGMPPAVREQLSEIVESFGSFLSNILQWNFGVQFGPSLSPVLPELSWRIKNSLILIGFSTAGSILAGAVIAIIAFIRKPNKRRPLTFAHSLKGFLFGLTPFIALILIDIFCLRLGLFPRAGLISLGRPSPGSAGWYMDFLAHLFLPVLTLTLVTAIRSATIVWSGSSSLDPKSSWKIFLLSITTVDFTFMVSAAFLVELLFGFPGVGQWFIGSLTESNHPVAIASFIGLLAITVGLGLVSSFLDLLQVSTGIRKDLEKPSPQHSEIEGQLHKRSHAKNKLTNYFKRKSLIIGLMIFFFFMFLGIAAPLLTPYLPSSQFHKAPRVASRYAMPEWMTIFPEYRDYNPTLTPILDSEDAELVNYTGPVEVNLSDSTFSFTADPEKTGPQKASVTIHMGNMTYGYPPPPPFTMQVSYEMFFNRTGVKVYFIIQNYTANPTWEEYFKDPTKAEMLIGKFSPPPEKYIISNLIVNDLQVDSRRRDVTNSLYDFTKFKGAPPDPALTVFSEKGVYGIQVRLEFYNIYPFEGAHAELYLKDVDLIIWGRLSGLFGTNSIGSDVWTELVYGARTIIPMSFGLAALAVVLGLPFGVLAGRFKGWTDNIVMVAAETFLSMPIFPLLLIYARYSHSSSGWLPILFWFLPAIATIAFRNVYLTSPTNNKSKRSEAFALFRYSLANFCFTAISVSLILTSIEFLGFGDPNLPTWGRMLYHAYQLGGLSAWWTSMVPIGFILLFTSGLFLIGSSLDEA